MIEKALLQFSRGVVAVVFIQKGADAGFQEAVEGVGIVRIVASCVFCGVFGFGMCGVIGAVLTDGVASGFVPIDELADGMDQVIARALNGVGDIGLLAGLSIQMRLWCQATTLPPAARSCSLASLALRMMLARGSIWSLAGSSRQ